MLTETSRVEAFSDGVFAIAITLLILDVRVPNGPAGSLASALIRQWPTYVSFLISFAFIGIMWVNHHRLFNHIRRCDNSLLFFNLLLLLGVTVVPFPTALLANRYFIPADRTVAAAVFNGTYFVIAIFFNVLWHHAVRSGLLDSTTLESADSIFQTIRSWTGRLSRLLGPHLDQCSGQHRRECRVSNFLRDSTQNTPPQAGGDAQCNEIVAFLDSPGVR
jgi:uncharacterized membrane protein